SLFQLAMVCRAMFVNLPVHARGLLVVNLHAIHSDIARTRARIACENHREGYKTPTVRFPTFQNREIEEIEFAFALNDFLARAGVDRAWEVFAEFGQLGQHFYFS